MNKKISIYEPTVLILGILLAIVSAAICMQIMGMFGTAPNTSLIVGVLIMIIARIPITSFKKLGNLERQNYIMSIASAAGFSAANGAFIGISMLFILERDNLIIPLSIGMLVASLISVFANYKLFDSKIFPSSGSWPMASVAAKILEAGNEGGKKSKELIQGILLGAILNQFSLPATGIGIAVVADIKTMTAMGLGSLISGFSPLINFNFGETNIAQGIMIGAGIVAFFQILNTIRGMKTTKTEECCDMAVTDKSAKKSLILVFVLFILGAILTAYLTYLFSHMNSANMMIWILYVALSTIITMLLVGTASMHSGIAPSFAVVTLFLTIGIAFSFPPIALAIMVGYVSCVGMVFADTGIGLKTGHILRKGIDEASGRRQQTIMKFLGVIIGILMAFFFGSYITGGGAIPPMSIFYARTISEYMTTSLFIELFLWAIPGAILQFVFGNKQVGLMLATGLLISNGLFGLFILVTLIFRIKFGVKSMAVRGPGLIAGDGLWGFIRIFF